AAVAADAPDVTALGSSDASSDIALVLGLSRDRDVRADHLERDRARQDEREGRARAGDAVHSQVAAQAAGEPPRQREPEADPAALAGMRSVELAERLED